MKKTNNFKKLLIVSLVALQMPAMDAGFGESAWNWILRNKKKVALGAVGAGLLTAGTIYAWNYLKNGSQKPVEIIDYDEERDEFQASAIAAESKFLSDCFCPCVLKENTAKVIRIDNQIAGFVVYKTDEYTIRSETSELWGKIEYIAVAKDFQKKGLARKLLEYAIEQMFEVGAKGIFLTVDKKNTIAIKFYESVNFKLVDRQYFLNSRDDYERYKAKYKKSKK